MVGGRKKGEQQVEGKGEKVRWKKKEKWGKGEGKENRGREEDKGKE